MKDFRVIFGSQAQPGKMHQTRQYRRSPTSSSTPTESLSNHGNRVGPASHGRRNLGHIIRPLAERAEMMESLEPGFQTALVVAMAAWQTSNRIVVSHVAQADDTGQSEWLSGKCACVPPRVEGAQGNMKTRLTSDGHPKQNSSGVGSISTEKTSAPVPTCLGG